MGKVQMQFTISAETMNSLRQEAEKLEITPNVLARIQLCQIYGSADAVDRSYLIKVKNWNEVEAYAEERGFEIGTFLNKAAEYYMKKNSLSPLQKTSANKNIEKLKKASADASAGPL